MMKNKLFDLVLIALCAALIAICAWISLPLGEVSFTLQTFAVFLTLGLLGGRNGSIAVLVYLALGAVGTPVFSGFRGGIAGLLGPTGGYLLGFLVSALAVWLLTALLGTRTRMLAFAFTVGLLVCYLFGTVWFLLVYQQSHEAVSLGTVLLWCVWPFLLPDAAKLTLALLLTARLRPVLEKLRAGR